MYCGTICSIKRRSPWTIEARTSALRAKRWRSCSRAVSMFTSRSWRWLWRLLARQAARADAADTSKTRTLRVSVIGSGTPKNRSSALNASWRPLTARGGYSPAQIPIFSMSSTVTSSAVRSYGRMVVEQYDRGDHRQLRARDCTAGGRVRCTRNGRRPDGAAHRCEGRFAPSAKPLTHRNRVLRPMRGRGGQRSASAGERLRSGRRPAVVRLERATGTLCRIYVGNNGTLEGS